MTIEYFPVGYDYLARFPSARQVIAGEGEACYAAEDGTDVVLITDSSTAAYLLGEEDVLTEAISVRQFVTVTERDAFIAARLGRKGQQKISMGMESTACNIMDNYIDINFDVYTDTPPGKDPDSYSPTLRKYHKLLWRKILPCGELFELVDTRPNTYLYHKSNLGEFFLGSDAITHSYRSTGKMQHIITQVPSEMVDSLFAHGSTIGAYNIFPANKINNQMTVNQARGVHGKIFDRFDLTLECIRLFYESKENPLSSVLSRYVEFFNLFCDFKGYVDFFHLQDLVATDYSYIKYHIRHRSFEESPLPQNVNEYLEYRKNTINFIRARGQRILASLNSRP